MISHTTSAPAVRTADGTGKAQGNGKVHDLTSFARFFNDGPSLPREALRREEEEHPLAFSSCFSPFSPFPTMIDFSTCFSPFSPFPPMLDIS